MHGAKFYEAHLDSANLERSIEFYENLGFKAAYTIEDRKAAFFFLGENKGNMLGIWETKDSPIKRSHIAFSVSPAKLRGTMPFLRKKESRRGNALAYHRKSRLSILGCQLLRYIFMIQTAIH